VKLGPDDGTYIRWHKANSEGDKGEGKNVPRITVWVSRGDQHRFDNFHFLALPEC